MDSLEDRIAAAGKSKEFGKAMADFENSDYGRDAQNILYEKLTNLGAEPEEASEFIDMLVDC